MDKQQTSRPDKDANDGFNANNAYSGSGAMQPGGDTGEAEKPVEYPDGGDGSATRSDPPEGRSISEATDPSKLSDI